MTMRRPRTPPPDEFDDEETVEVRRPRLAAGSIAPPSPSTPLSPPLRRRTSIRRPTKGERTVIKMRSDTPVAPGADVRPSRRR